MDIQTLTAALVGIVAVETSYLSYRTVKGQAAAKSTSIFVDTSVLIDGRILQLASTGFVPGELVIPRSVIGELQLLADGSDGEKRERARRGLDVVRQLQDTAEVNVSIHADGSRAPEGVDDRLLSLAKKYGGKLLTIDYNLNKVAQVEGITVLNINDLAKQLRMSYLPGDTVTIELTQPGSDSHQAIGHLEDGTMIVVEHAKQLIGKRQEVEVIRNLQTSAGRMMFAKLVTKPKAAETPVVKKRYGAGRKPFIARPASSNDNKIQPQPQPSQKQASPKAQPTQKPAEQANRSQQPKRRSAKQQEASLVDLANRS